MYVAIKNLSVSFPVGFRRQQSLQVLQHLSLQLSRGQTYGLLGPNGAGKTTLIQAMLNLISYQEGELLFDNKYLSQDTLDHIGYCPDQTAFYEYLTGWENIKMFGILHHLSLQTINRVSDHFLELLQLGFAKDRMVRTYSAGMKKRLGLVISLLHNPDLLIRDEPMSGVDPLGRILIKDLIAQLHNQGKTILFSTHILSDVEQIADMYGILHQGSIMYESSIDQLDQPLEQLFRDKILSQIHKVY